jgi:hypothetical protein
MKKIVALLLITLSSCGQELSPYPHTGQASSETIISASIESREQVQEGRIYYITTENLNVRSSDRITNNNIMGKLNTNDQVRVVNSSQNFEGDFVQVEIVSAKNIINSSAQYFISFRYIDTMFRDLRAFTGTYFMIQNIATEKLRVYERVCADYSCPHRLILETNVVMGEDSPGERTNVGSFRISEWRKFYQDHAAKYPSWYDPSYPAIPGPGSKFTDWFKKRHMPPGPGEMRGAFGWYTALVEPNHAGQWTHGTIGWGADKQDFIDKTKKLIPNLVTSPRSHGCTRTDNETIAYLREILPVGTPVVKVYAIEELGDRSLRGYTQIPMVWDYILTTRGVRVDGQKAGAREVLASGVSPHEILDRGMYYINRWPSVVEFKDGIGRFRRKLGQKGNLYGVDGQSMRGVYYVDQGLLQDYAHPPELGVGGYTDEVIPTFMNAQFVQRRR